MSGDRRKIFIQFFDSKSSTYTYLLASGPGREAVIIDPVKANVKEYIKALRAHNIRLAVAIDTHLHADHITGTGVLKQSERCAIMMGAETEAQCVDANFSDNERYNFDGIKILAKHTPGHTQDSYCYYVNDAVLFTGDTLLINATGRTDFQLGSAEQQYHSLFDNILLLPDNTTVYPAHDYNDKTSSTIGAEKRFNPRLQVRTKKEYVAMMNDLNLPKPKMMDIAVPANVHCGLTASKV